MNIKKILSIIIFYLAFATFGVSSHQCQHHKKVGQAQLIPEHLMEHKWKGRNLQQKSGPIRITFDRTILSTLNNQALQDRLNRLLDNMSNFLVNLLHVNQLDTNKYIVSRSCDGNIITDQMRNTGIPNSDLHVFLRISNNTQAYLAAATVCQLNPRPTYGSIEINIFNFNSNINERSYSIQFNSLLHEMIHLLGFSIESIPYFLTPSGDFYYYTAFTSQTIRGIETPIYSTPKLLDQVRNIFNCSSLKGMQFENQGSFGTMYSHFEQTISLYELMGPSTSMTIPQLTNLTLALLDDSNFYTFVNYTMASPHFFAQNMGCDFYTNACFSSTTYSQYCYESGTTKCDNYRTAMSQCTQSQFSDNCSIYLLGSDQDCIDPSTTPIDPVKIGDYYGTDARCFDSNIKFDKLNRYGLYGRCYKYKCNSNSTLSVFIANTEYLCTKQNQVLVPLPAGSTGSLVCPDITKLCGYNFVCPHGCSQRGSCIGGVCQCYDGYSGKACQCFPGTTPDSNDNCVCPQGQANNGTTCIKCNQNCLDCQNNLQCNTCTNGYRVASGNGQCTQCKDGQYDDKNSSGALKCSNCSNQCSQCSGSNNFCTKCSQGKFLLRSSGICLSNCPLGYYQNNALKECIVCSVSDCLSCNTGPSVCDACSSVLTLSYNQISCNFSCLSTEYQTTASVITNGQSITTQKCIACSLQCQACYGSDKTNCTQCSSTTFLYNNTCLNSCPTGTFGDNINRVCSQCTSNCLACTSSDLCTQCSASTYQLKQPVSSNDPTIQTICVTQCPSTTYKVEANNQLNIIATCSSCISNCASCTNSTNCSACFTGFLIFVTSTSVTCLTECPNANQVDDRQGVIAYYTDISTSSCLPCIGNCGLCSNQSTCTTCKLGYYKYSVNGSNDKCSNDCPQGYAQDQVNRVCQQCIISNCNACNIAQMNKCTKCSKGYYLLLGDTTNDPDQCLNNCPITQGYYKDQTNNQCLKCSINCQQCQNQNKCLSCTSSTFLITENTTGNDICIISCPSGYFKTQNSNKNVCAQCLDNCDNCTNKTTCAYCAKGYYLYQQVQQQDLCVQVCPIGNYLDSTIQSCKQCIQNCQSCTNATTCDTCSPSYLRLRSLNAPDSCVSKCPIGYYTSSSDCLLCYDGCQVCQDSNSCQQCQDSYYFLAQGLINGQQNDQCVSKCPSGFFPRVNPNQTGGQIQKCNQCSSNCINCQDARQCNQCATNYFIYRVQNKPDLCLITCPQNYYPNPITGFCTECLNNCQDCSSLGINSNKCYQCLNGYYLLSSLDGDKCLLKCPQQYYFQNELTKNCDFCQTSNCGACSTTNSSVCDSCQPNYYLVQQTDLPNSIVDQCVQECPIEGFYQDQSHMKCVKCSEQCLQCSRKNICKVCAKDYYLNQTSQIKEDIICVANCPPLKFANSQNMKCDQCQTNCQLCSSSTQCTTCQPNYYLYQLTTEKNECRTQCGIGMFENQLTQKCDICINNCDKCYTSSDCALCTNGFNLYQVSLNLFQCVQTCPQNFFAINQICKPCLQNCSTCSSNFQCQVCSLGFNLLQLTTIAIIQSPDYSYNSDYCISSTTACPQGTYLDNITQECKLCQFNCESCSSSQYCNVCKNPYILLIQQSSSGMFTDCNLFCPEGYYIETINNTLTNRKCSNCLPNCKICTNGVSCSQCQDYFTLQIAEQFIENNPNTTDQCLSNCPQGYYFNDKSLKCEGCSINCLTCTSGINCLKCQDSYFLLQNQGNSKQKCVKSCPLNNYYENKITQECDRCSISNCSICNLSAKSCQKCLDGYYYFQSLNQQPGSLQGECLQQCPPYYFIDNQSGNCLQCVSGCLNCSSPQKCNLCAPQLFLQQQEIYNTPSDQCSTSCGEGYFEWQENETSQIVCKKCLDTCKICHNIAKCDICKDTYFLFTGKENDECLIECPQSGYFANQEKRICENCIDGCIQCQDSLSCQKCQQDLIFFKQTDIQGNFIKDSCIIECPQQGYYLNKDNQEQYRCQKCSIKNCQICPSSKSCTKCEIDYYLYYNIANDSLSCINQCPDHYYANVNSGNCSQCLENCLICTNSTQCQVCDQFFSLQSSIYMGDTGQDSCSDNCPIGTYKEFDSNNSQYICKPCLNNCKVCSSPAVCSICKSGFSYLERSLLQLPQDQCLLSCPLGFVNYMNILDETQVYSCVKCEDNCIDCSNPITNSYWYSTLEMQYNTSHTQYCNQCKNGYLKFTQKDNQFQVSCLNICPYFYFADDEQQICSPCQNGCKQCINQQICLSCDQNLILVKAFENEQLVSAQCLTSCPNQQYFDLQKNECKQCSNNCDNCTQESKCNACQEGYVLQNDQCINLCGEQYYLENNLCKQCSSNCIKCKDSQLCLECRSGYLILEQVSNLNGIAIIQDICVSSCPISYFKSINSLNKANQIPRCIQCSSHCAQCLDENTCYSCDSQYFLFTKNNSSVLIADQCLSTCPDNFYKDLGSSTCSRCLQNCQDCSNSTNCNKCQDQYYQIFYQGQVQCVQECPSGYYPDNNQGDLTCKKCSQNCMQCSSQLLCLSCESKYNLYSFQQEGQNMSICVQTCPNGYYNNQDPILSLCIKCLVNNCSQCNQNSCDKCDTSYYLIQSGIIQNQQLDQCVLTCPSFTYASELQQRCNKCINNCKLCSDSLSCSQCDNSYFLFRNSLTNQISCIQECPNGFYSDKILGICNQCETTNCKTCSSYSRCEECNFNYKLLKSQNLDLPDKCITNCPVYFYEKTISNPATGVQDIICEKCPDNCVNCKDNSICIKCDTNYGLLDGSCLNYIPQRYYLINQTLLSCLPNCLNCKDYNTCNQCQDNTYLLHINGQSDQCLQNCPVQYFNQISSQTCQSCLANCDYCADSSTCNQCSKNYYILSKNFNDGNTDLCTQTCGIGRYVDSAQNKCESCSNNCNICSSSSICTQCNSGYKLFQNICISSCPIGYRDNINICISCKNNCLSCPKSENSCSICSNSYYLSIIDNQCYPCLNSEVNCDECSQQLKYKQNSSSTDDNSNYNCLKECNDGYYPDIDPVTKAYICKKCSVELCQKCTSSTCLTCFQSHPYMLDGQCAVKCPIGYYSQVQQILYNGQSINQIFCNKCSASNCNICNSTGDKCLTCLPGTYLYESSCIVQCPNGTQTDDINKQCIKCQLKNCSKCSVNQNICELCTQSFYLSPTDQQCHPCMSNCLTCSELNQCRLCNNGYFFDQIQGSCVTSCLVGYYKNTQTNTCELCNKACKTCLGPNNTDCLSCSNIYYSQTTSLPLTCLEGCGPGKVRRTKLPYLGLVDECQSCFKGCKTCYDVFNTQCLSCQDGYTLINNTCKDCTKANCTVI